MRLRLSQPGKPAIFVIVGVLLLATSAYALDVVILQSPQRVWWSAMQTSMALKGVACTVHKQDDNQEIWLDLTGKKIALVTTTLSQNGTTVTTQDINTPQADYIRYTSVATAAKNTSGKALDTSKILNVWAKQPRTPASSPSILGQVALGGCIVPLVNVPQPQSDQLTAELKKGKVFQTNFAKSAYHWSLTRPYRDYAVTVDPTDYIPFMKQVDSLYGTQALSSVSADSFNGSKSQQLTFRIDAYSRRIQKIWYNGRPESFTFTRYGQVPQTTPPSKTISVTELQQRLQALQ